MLLAIVKNKASMWLGSNVYISSTTVLNVMRTVVNTQRAREYMSLVARRCWFTCQWRSIKTNGVSVNTN